MAKKVAKRIGDEAVKAKTGKVWKEWFKILDAAGAKKMTHTEIARHLYGKCKVPGWWSQMVANQYEQERGLRAARQDTNGNFAARSKPHSKRPASQAIQILGRRKSPTRLAKKRSAGDHHRHKEQIHTRGMGRCDAPKRNVLREGRGEEPDRDRSHEIAKRGGIEAHEGFLDAGGRTRARAS